MARDRREKERDAACWLTVALPRSGWLLPIVVGGGVRQRHTGQCRDEHGGRVRGRRRAERGEKKKGKRERERAFLRRDSRTGADTPPHPRIFRTPRSPSLALSTYLPPSLSRSLLRVRPFSLSLSLSSPLSVLHALDVVVAAATSIALLVARGHSIHSILHLRGAKKYSDGE